MYIMSTRMCTYMCTHIYYICPYSGYTKIHIYVNLTHIYHIEMCPYIYHIDTYVYIYWIYVSTYILHMHIYEMYIDPHILDVCGSHTYIQHLYLYGHIRVRSTLWLIYLIYWIYVGLNHTSNTTYIYMDTYVCDQWSQRQTHMCEIYQHLHLYDTYVSNTYICMHTYVYTYIHYIYTYVWDLWTPISVCTHMRIPEPQSLSQKSPVKKTIFCKRDL